MPCSSSDGMGSVNYGDLAELRRKNDELTQMLCLTLRTMEAQGILFQFPASLQRWYEQHRAWDKSQGR